ncbi:neutral zinc metallopeptidase [Agromyces sp. Leaf222]|uniref:KPN_02809 family neutral zinc metallopeptidase n=1 Tax=Agromyces sp. Leaf222 TaxID=1735688 RepID=UPI0006F1C875|nr:neutral zinc metallopeptidase [Agromyces sp. Leaf222]KQM81447.1 neutral zinc metallopeptidase [Agromyces sp. Leaf222]
MTFNPNADISGGKASKRGRNTGIAVAGGLGVIALVVVSQLLGVDLTGLLGGGGEETAPDSSIEECLTGQQANERVDCRMKGASASLEAYWEQAAPQELGLSYTAPNDFVQFDQATSTGCGSATSATGPFYCPPDQTIYVDVTFFDELENRFGSSGGPLAQMYVVAHEWGHHVQNLAGTLEAAQDGQTGPTSNSVRTELQADCFAGAWVANAANTTDDQGVSFLVPPTAAEVADALSAAAAVGDDRIQEAAQGQVTPHTFTHGTSEQRQSWFTTGYEQGAAACDTFGIDGSQL